MFKRKSASTEEVGKSKYIPRSDMLLVLRSLMRGTFVSFPVLEEIRFVDIKRLEDAARQLAQAYGRQAHLEEDSYRRLAATTAARYYDLVARIAADVSMFKRYYAMGSGLVLLEDIVPLGLLEEWELECLSFEKSDEGPYVKLPSPRFETSIVASLDSVPEYSWRLASLKRELDEFSPKAMNEYLTVLGVPENSWLRPLEEKPSPPEDDVQAQVSNDDAENLISQIQLKRERFKQQAAKEWRRMHPENRKLTREMEDKGYFEMGPVLDATEMTPMQVFPKGIELGELIRKFEGKKSVSAPSSNSVR